MMQKKLFMALLSAGALCGCVKEEMNSNSAPTPQAPVVEEGDDIVEGWVRLKFSEDALPMPVGAFTRGAMNSGDEQLDSLAAALGATEVRRVFHEGGKFAERRRRFGLHLWYDVRFDENIPYTRAAAGFAGLPDIVHVQPIYKVQTLDNAPSIPAEAVYMPMSLAISRPDAMPYNDPDLPKQWHYNNTGDGKNFVEGADINLFEAWKTETGYRSVIVAVNDSGGVDFDHPDLADNMWVNEAELNGEEGVDDDGNGYVDDIYGWNGPFDNGEIHPGPHATHVAGTIAAVNNNGIGVCGIAGGTGKQDGVRLMSIAITDNGGGAFAANPDIFAYEADNGAVISQNSWAYSGSTMPQDVSEALDYFIATAGTDENGDQVGPMKGGIVIFAAGNSKGGTSLYPASDPRVISVAAMNPDYSKALYSNYGDDVDIFAPGGSDANDSRFEVAGQVYSTSVDTDGSPIYNYQSGTSMACPHVSGVAALIVSHYARKGEPLTAEQCKEILLRSFRPVGEAVGEQYYDKLGVGLVDAGYVFTTDSGKEPAAVTEPSAKVAKNRFTLEWIAPADGNDMAVSHYEISYVGKGVGKREGQPDVTDTFQLRNVFEPQQEASYVWYGFYNVNYTFNVVAVDRFGNRSQAASMSVTSGDYENVAPKTLQNFGTFKFEEAGEEYAKQFNLLEYFADENLEEGDVLTFTVENGDDKILDVKIEGTQMTVTPLAKGTARVTVVAADLDKATTQALLSATVVNGPAPETGGSGLYPNPADDTVYVTLEALQNTVADAVVYDQAARVVMKSQMQFDASGTAELNVADLRPGSYILSLRQGGKNHTMGFMKR